MASIVEQVPYRTPKAPPASLTWRLLTGLWGLVRRHQASLDPEELPPHLLRDLGLADQGFRSNPVDRWIR
jgi:hypothetical protein